jgi:hypothetical protein
MANTENRSSLDDLRREVGRIELGHGTFRDITKVPDYRSFTPVQPDTRLRPAGRTKGREAFGRWLLAQTDRGDWIDPIAAAARKDSAFPKDGDPDAVRQHLAERGADSDTFAAIDDAELDWAAL